MWLLVVGLSWLCPHSEPALISVIFQLSSETEPGKLPCPHVQGCEDGQGGSPHSPGTRWPALRWEQWKGVSGCGHEGGTQASWEDRSPRGRPGGGKSGLQEGTNSWGDFQVSARWPVRFAGQEPLCSLGQSHTCGLRWWPLVGSSGSEDCSGTGTRFLCGS